MNTLRIPVDIRDVVIEYAAQFWFGKSPFDDPHSKHHRNSDDDNDDDDDDPPQQDSSTTNTPSSQLPSPSSSSSSSSPTSTTTTPSLLLERLQEQDEATATLLLAHTAWPVLLAATNRHGRTALHLCCIEGYTELMTYLFVARQQQCHPQKQPLPCPWCRRDHGQYTALDWALNWSHVRIASRWCRYAACACDHPKASLWTRIQRATSPWRPDQSLLYTTVVVGDAACLQDLLQLTGMDHPHHHHDMAHHHDDDDDNNNNNNSSSSHPHRQQQQQQHQQQQYLDWLHQTATGLDVTALHVAARDGRLDLVQMLVHAGASVHVVDALGRTPLHYAVLYRRTAVATWLLQQQAQRDHHSDEHYCLYTTAASRILAGTHHHPVYKARIDAGLARLLMPSQTTTKSPTDRCRE